MSQKIQDRKEPSMADLEAFERLLRDSLQQSGQPTPPAPVLTPPPAPKSANTTLAELARIVNDPAPFGSPPSFDPLPKPEPFLHTEVKAEMSTEQWPDVAPVAAPALDPAFQAVEDELANLAKQAPSAQDDPLFAFEEELRRFDEARSAAPAAPDLRMDFADMDFADTAPPAPILPYGAPQSRPAPAAKQASSFEHAYYAPKSQPMSSQPMSSQPTSQPGAFAAPQATPQAAWQSTQQDHYSEHHDADELSDPHNLQQHGLEQAEARLAAEAAAAAAASEAQPNRSRTIFMALGGIAVAGLATIGVMFAFGGGKKAATPGNVPVISASKTPTKEKPTDPGGVDVPDQNKGILAPKVATESKPGQVVSNTEQPMDLSQVTRQNSVRVVAPNPYQGSASAPPGVTAPPEATPGNPLEPRRVTSVRIPTGEQTPAAQSPVAPKTSATPSMAGLAAGAMGAGAAPSAARPVTPIASTTPSAPRAPEPPKVVEPPKAAEPVKAQTRPPVTPVAPRPVTPAPAAPRAANAPMSLTPAPAPRNAAAAPASRPAATSSGSGGYAIQLASRPTEADARSASAQLKAKYASAIGSRGTSVVSGEANGKTVYRVRVGGYSQTDAAQACEKVKAFGGGCFVTRQ